jgi:hypothetical protein
VYELLFFIGGKMANIYTKKRLTKEEKADKDILTTALERYQECDPVCQEIYREAIDDIKFSIGDQWEARTLQDRQDRPSLVENRVSGMIHQVCNDQRQNRSMIKVTPRDDNGDPETSEIINGLLRYIQYHSDSETAVDTAFENAVRGGIGWYRIVTDYEDSESFNQEICFKRIDDIQSVKVPIHLCRDIDFRDMPYAFVETTISKDEFEKEYPDVDVDEWPSTARYEGWASDDQVKIAEYFVVEKKYKEIYLLSDNSISEEKPADESGLTVVTTRPVCKKQIKWYKITAGTILDRKDFPGEWIPILPVLGEDVTIAGKRKFLSLTRNAKDPQRMLNYWRSAEAERIALSPKAPFIAAANQLEGYEDEWAQANRTNINVLHYNPVIEGGNLVPAPDRTMPTQMDMAIVNAARESVDAIKACTGIFDASLGNQSAETSGRAILARQRQGDTSNYHFFDNLAKSLRHACRIIVDLIPEIYDAERTIRILGEDLKDKVVTVNKMYSADGKLYDLTAGKYDVIVETGPSFMSQRQETATNLQNLAQSDPVIVQCARDLILKYMDLPSEIVERARKTIPPQFVEDENKQNDPQQMQAAIAQSQQQLQQMDMVIQQLSQENEQLQQQAAGKVLDNQTKLQIADLQAKVNILTTQMKLGIDQEKMQHEVGIKAMQHSNDIARGDYEAMRGVMINQPRQPAAYAE